MVTIQITEEQQKFLIEAAEDKFKKLMSALSGPKNKFVLTAERVRIIKDLGLWDNELHRSWAIKAFLESDQNADDRETLMAVQHRVEMLDIERKKQEAENQFVKGPEPTVLEKAKKKIAAKRKPRKSKDAPYGFKKDGTPKKRPGRAPKEA